MRTLSFTRPVLGLALAIVVVSSDRALAQPPTREALVAAAERAPGPVKGREQAPITIVEGTGQNKYPDIQFEDGSWYHEESKEMERTIREGRLMEKATGGPSAEGGTEPA